MTDPDTGQHGFTLIEVLVAFAILAVAFAIVMPLFSDNASSTQKAFNEKEAVLIAESMLAEVGTTQPLAAAERSGVLAGGFSWTVKVSPAPDLHDRSPRNLGVYDVMVQVSWESGGPTRAVNLHTLRLGAALP